MGKDKENPLYLPLYLSFLEGKKKLTRLSHCRAKSNSGPQKVVFSQDPSKLPKCYQCF